MDTIGNLTVECGEGIVLYLEDQNDVRLIKVKSLEYRVYRKLREKLKNDRENKIVLHKYAEEVKDLVKDQLICKKL